MHWTMPLTTSWLETRQVLRNWLHESIDCWCHMKMSFGKVYSMAGLQGQLDDSFSTYVWGNYISFHFMCFELSGYPFTTQDIPLPLLRSEHL